MTSDKDSIIMNSRKGVLPLNNITGERIKEILKQRGIKQKDLTEAVYVSPVTMNRYLQGGRKIPANILLDISVQIQADIRYLLGEVDHPTAYIVNDSLQMLEHFNPAPQERLKQLLTMYGFQTAFHVEGNSMMVYTITKGGETIYTLTGVEFSALASAVDLAVQNSLVNFLDFSQKIIERKDE